MITFLTLMIMAILVLVVSILVLSIGGAVGIVIFGDLIVCVLLIVWLMKKLFKK